MRRISVISISCASSLFGAAVGAKCKEFELKNNEHDSKSNRFRFPKPADVTEILSGALGKFVKSPRDVEASNFSIPLPIVSAATNLPSTYQPPPVLSPSPSKGTRSEEIMRFGFPGFENLRTYGDYVLSYDNRTRNARWVCEHLTRERVKTRKEVGRENSEFVEDGSIHQYFRATNDDYRGSGYDRGHLAAAANHRISQQAMDETFLLSNCSPQVGVGFNRGAWSQLEKLVRALAREYKNVYVCSGPLYLPRKEDNKHIVKYEVVGRNFVAVPTHFFKVIVMEQVDSGFELLSFVMPNQSIGKEVDLAAYLVPLESVERASGLILFEKIPRNGFRRVNVL